MKNLGLDGELKSGWNVLWVLSEKGMTYKTIKIKMIKVLGVGEDKRGHEHLHHHK
jgi:hypothetical protein